MTQICMLLAALVSVYSSIAVWNSKDEKTTFGVKVVASTFWGILAIILILIAIFPGPVFELLGF